MLRSHMIDRLSTSYSCLVQLIGTPILDRHLAPLACTRIPAPITCLPFLGTREGTDRCMLDTCGCITSDMSGTSRYRHNPRIASMRRRRDGRALRRHGPTGPYAGGPLLRVRLPRAAEIERGLRGRRRTLRPRRRGRRPTASGGAAHPAFPARRELARPRPAAACGSGRACSSSSLFKVRACQLKLKLTSRLASG
jgi:hypothetical protein